MGSLCEALGVSRGGFYAWLSRPKSARSLADEVLGAKVFQSFVASDRTYGASDLPPLAIPFKSSKSGSRLIDFDG